MVVIVSKSKHSVKKPYSVRRQEGNKRYRPIILIGTEGTDTEPDYFNLVRSIFNSVTIKICPSRGMKGSSPDRVLKRMRSELALTPLKKDRGDQAWIVIDRDQWTNEQFDHVFDWEKEKSHYHVAISNPKFEYWLLLHFYNASGIRTPREVEEKLLKYLPNYNKHLSSGDISKEGILEAIERCSSKTHSSQECLSNTGTTVGKLMKEIIRLDAESNG